MLFGISNHLQGLEFRPAADCRGRMKLMDKVRNAMRMNKGLKVCAQMLNIPGLSRMSITHADVAAPCILQLLHDIITYP